MFIELEPVFNNIGSKKMFEYSFVLEDCEIREPAKAKGVVENRAGVVTLTADTVLEYQTVCDRCLKPLTRTVQKQFVHTLVSALNDEDNGDFILVEDMHFDLDELLREDILLHIPTKELCKPDCKGLCPMCGADLNVTTCSCKPPVDPRLAVLQSLLDNEEP